MYFETEPDRVVVDDDPSIADAFRITLRHQGAEATETGRGALDLDAALAPGTRWCWT